ncbi:MAG: PEP-CTERM sorting domain-containing protein [Alphaproteobacteria bacterium]
MVNQGHSRPLKPLGLAAMAVVAYALVAGTATADVIEYDGVIFSRSVNGASFSELHNGNSGSSGPVLYVLPNQSLSYSIDRGANNAFGDTGDRVFFSGSQTLDLAAAGADPGSPGTLVAKMVITGFEVIIQSATFNAAPGLTDAFGTSIAGQPLHRIQDNGSMSFEIRSPDAAMNLLFSGIFDFDDIVAADIFNGVLFDTRPASMAAAGDPNAAVLSTFLWGSTNGTLSNPGSLKVKDIIGGSNNTLITNIGVDIAFSGQPIPEPATLLVLGGGLLGLGFMRRRRRN